ncbi:structural maintenance of chromosomes protein 5 [Holotrichia oblita]|uniref:Structural maintenance of chromosomes protein 5 n=1 Tax=Holotrichia oblita TaxID=644536 RepID=A0ACB9TQ00_HOLOL|nr:structural maintenance of chromosomes protein 5 [Holotrichia oblita]
MSKPGVILKISVTNFVTYTYAEMYPGPHLNMIVGPNGTGKSTMVAAIILGLGGNPKTVGRGTKVSEYVKHNCQAARIDIVLKGNNTSNSNTVITREFDVNDRSIWRLNGSKVSQKDMLDNIALYNIQVDNLCQFLPQDRVQDFAKMNKQELRNQHKNALETVGKRTKKLQEAKDANSRLEGKVTNFNKRKKFLLMIKNIDRKIAWRNYEDINERRENIKADKAQATQILNAHKTTAQPIETDIKNKQRSVSKLQNHLAECVKVQEETKARIADILQREQELRTENMKLAKLQSDKEDLLNAYGNDEEMQRKLQQYADEIKQISNQIGVIEAKKSELQMSKRDKMYESRALENELSKIENVKQQRLEYLRRLDSDAYNATLWLRDNSQNFKGQVFEPMMLELNVIEPANAVYIENTIPVRDRVAFTCTNKEDMNSLIRSLRDNQKLGVNIVYSDPAEKVPMFQPRIPIERLRSYGLYAYLLSLLSGPPPIITYLCKNYRIHNTPVGNEQTNKSFEDVPKEISTFFSNKFKFSCSYSRYTGEKIVRQNEIRSDGCLSISVDLAKLENIQGQLNDNRRECERYDDQIRELQNGITQFTERKGRLAESLKNIRTVSQNIQTIDTRIRVVNTRLQQLQQDVTTEADIRNEADTKIKNIIKQMVNITKSQQEKFQAYSRLRCDIDVKQLQITILERQITTLENRAYDLRQICEEAERTLQNIKQQYDEITKDAKLALQKGKDISNGCTPNQDGFNEFREEYDKLSDNLEELEREKSEIVGRMECLTTADDDEMREYEQRLELIQQLEDSLRNDTTEIENINKKIAQMESNYLVPLQELVDQISSRFSAAFERMGCAGEVSIYQGNSPQDYEKYGLNIKVTYRNGEPLQELNNNIQSGGERAVATATYMLSLQELTPVPFRCVDEINQGMDEINERRIFELLFDSTSQPNTSQYFLITPKLIPNLEYVPSMKIHFVHNGPFVVPQTEWNRIKM